MKNIYSFSLLLTLLFSCALPANAQHNETSTNIAGSAQGLSPGVLIWDSSGPDAFPFTMIRSLSANGTRPLILLDGFPIEGDLASINPNDVESVSFLKDASTLAIYGSGAAGGAILITTKYADSKEFKLRFSTRQGISNSAFSAPDFDKSEQTGYRQDYYISAGAQKERFSYLISAGYLNENTQYRDESFNRLTGRVNMTFSPTNRIDGVANLSGTIDNRLNRTIAEKATNDLLLLNFHLPVGFKFTVLGDLELQSGDISGVSTKTTRELYQTILEWNGVVEEDHSIGVFAGREFYIVNYKLSDNSNPDRIDLNSWFAAMNYKFKDRLLLDLSICKTEEEEIFSYSFGAQYKGDIFSVGTTYGEIGDSKSFTLGFITKIANKADLSLEYFNNRIEIVYPYNPSEIIIKSSNGIEMTLFSDLISNGNVKWNLGVIATWIAKYREISLPPLFGSIVSSLDLNRFHFYTLITLGTGYKVESAKSYRAGADKRFIAHTPELYDASNASIKRLYIGYDLSDVICRNNNKRITISLSADNLFTLRASDQINPYSVAGTPSCFRLPRRTISLGLNIQWGQVPF